MTSFFGKDKQFPADSLLFPVTLELPAECLSKKHYGTRIATTTVVLQNAAFCCLFACHSGASDRKQPCRLGLRSNIYGEGRAARPQLLLHAGQG